MDVTLFDMILKRRSFHLFMNVGKETITEAELSETEEKYRTFTPLYPGIRTEIRIVPEKETNCRCGAEYCILLYSEKKDGYLQNIGYLGEQLDLYLVSRGIGTLWFGIGKTEERSRDGMDYVIMIAVRRIGDETKFRRDADKCRRKPVGEIWSGEAISGVTELVRLAPSACNSQPWFVNNSGTLTVYRNRRPGKIGIMPADKVPFYNRIDLGIFLCFLDLCLARRGIDRERTLLSDDGTGEGLIPNAVYTLK
jgi:hypothetical protein